MASCITPQARMKATAEEARNALVAVGKNAYTKKADSLLKSVSGKAKTVPDVIREALDYIRNQVSPAQHVNNEAVKMISGIVEVIDGQRNSMIHNVSRLMTGDGGLNELAGSPLQRFSHNILRNKETKNKNTKLDILLFYSKYLNSYNGEKLTKIELDKLEMGLKELEEIGFMGATRNIEQVKSLLDSEGGKIKFKDVSGYYEKTFGMLDEMKAFLNSAYDGIIDSWVTDKGYSITKELREYFETKNEKLLHTIFTQAPKDLNGNMRTKESILKDMKELQEIYDTYNSAKVAPGEFYLPNSRHGDNAVAVRNKDGELILWEQYKNASTAIDRLNEIKDDMERLGHTLTFIELDKLSATDRSKYEPYITKDIETEVASKIKAMIKSGEIASPKEIADAFRRVHLSEMRKSKNVTGGRKHFEGKRGIAGYEADGSLMNIIETTNQIANYAASQTKSNKLLQLTNSKAFLSEYEISSKADKQYINNFLNDMMTPSVSDMGSKVVSTIQSVMFAKHLGLNLANGVLQTFQAYHNVPIFLNSEHNINMFKTFAAIGKAQKDLARFILNPSSSGLEKSRLNAEEADFLSQLLESGILKPVYGESLRGNEDTLFGDIARRTGIFTDRGDTLARASTALATYRLLRKNGKGRHVASMEASQAVKHTQFQFGQIGAMPAARRSQILKLLATFQNFSMHQMHFMRDFVFGGISPELVKGKDGHYHFKWSPQKEGIEKAAANFGWSAVISALVGGIGAVPFANELSLGQITDLEDKLSERQANDVSNILLAVANHGIPGAVGVSLKNKMRFDLTNLWNPLGNTVVKSEYENVTRGIDKLFAGENIKEWGQMIPVPVLWKLAQTARGMDNVKVGKYDTYYIDYRDMSIKPLTYANMSGVMNMFGFKTVKETDIRTIINAEREMRLELNKLRTEYKERMKKGEKGAKEIYAELSSYEDAFKSSQRTSIKDGYRIVRTAK